MDLVYFLVLAGAGIGLVIWLPAFYLLYMLTQAVFVYGAPEVLIVAVVSALAGTWAYGWLRPRLPY